ncbi:SHOCT domain-containing protein [Streptomyces sp. NPDC001389]|uniref:SHOCT domain-containing protein n=1 Tax=unclassified Streptomyces TaxID=2593676 RepID=UPI003689B3F7
MMFWYDHDVSGRGWFAMSVGMILFGALIITAAVLLFRALERPHEHMHTSAAPTPEHILAQRLARGEADEDEYKHRLAALHTHPQNDP